MPTMDALTALADEVPVLNKKAAAAAQARQAVAVQSQVGQTTGTPGLSTTRMAQAAAPQAVAQQAQAAITADQQTQQQLGQIGATALQAKSATDEAGLAAQDQAQRERLAKQEQANKLQQSRADIGMRKKVTGAEQEAAARMQKLGIEVDNKLQLATIRQREQLSRLGGDVKDQILDSRLQFERDEMGRKFTNERQLADYTLANAKTDIEFKDKMREMQQSSERNLQLLEAVEKKLRQAISQDWQFGEQQLDNESKARLTEMVKNMKDKIRRQQARAKANAQAWQAGGMLVGGIAGGVVTGGNPAGVMGGAALGGALGGVVGSSQNQNSENTNWETA